jgi:hypothetical protein
METETKNKLSDAIVQLSKDKDVIDVVSEIENGVKTTKDHYGKYMQFLTPYVKDKISLYVISEALKIAGGNAQGINSALILLKGGY